MDINGQALKSGIQSNLRNLGNSHPVARADSRVVVAPDTSRLEPLPTRSTYWFFLVANYPDIDIYRPE